MHTIIRLLPALALLLLFMIPGSTSAHTTIPALTHLCDYGAGSGCFSIQAWSGISTNGAMTTTTVDNPNFGSLVQYNKFIELFTADGSYAIVGMGRASDVCGTGNLYWFTDIAPAGAKQPVQCHGVVNSNDVNQDVDLEAVEYSGGVDFYISGHVDNPCNPCQYADSHFGTHQFTASNEQVEFAVTNGTGFTGHDVWGGRWRFNAYHEGLPGNWAFDGSSGSFSQSTNENGFVFGGSNTPPGQILWNSPPNGNTNSGGTLYTCEYDSTSNSCTFGS